jgi:FimV-like protein
MTPLMINTFWVFLASLFFIIIIFSLTKRLLKKKDLPPKKFSPVIKTQSHASQQQAITISSRDIKAIAGEDLLATQLDLARAYIETGRKQLAQKMLKYIMQQGSHSQQQEAERLLIKLNS